LYIGVGEIVGNGHIDIIGMENINHMNLEIFQMNMKIGLEE